MKSFEVLFEFNQHKPVYLLNYVKHDIIKEELY